MCDMDKLATLQLEISKQLPTTSKSFHLGLKQNTYELYVALKMGIFLSNMFKEEYKEVS